MGGKFRVEYLPVAQRDLTEIIEYIQVDSPTAAIRLLDEIDEAISRLEEFPLIGHVPNDPRLKALNYRILVVGNYLVFCVVADDVIEIRRVLHGKRQYEFLL
ncbi:MAG: type II toxin-antitoxin system RelE/ParE family toxin [Bacillota bacterium]